MGLGKGVSLPGKRGRKKKQVVLFFKRTGCREDVSGPVYFSVLIPSGETNWEMGHLAHGSSSTVSTNVVPCHQHVL